MPRLALPIPRDRSGRRRTSPAGQALQACSQRLSLAFASINLPTSFPDPLKDIKPMFDFPWLLSLGPDSEEHPSRRRLLTVGEFFRYTEEQGRLCHLAELMLSQSSRRRCSLFVAGTTTCLP
jgi:hypothetical protein